MSAWNGPEFEAWAYAANVQLALIRPGKPNENAIESFNGKFRDEFLNEHRSRLHRLRLVETRAARHYWEALDSSDRCAADMRSTKSSNLILQTAPDTCIACSSAIGGLISPAIIRTRSV